MRLLLLAALGLSSGLLWSSTARAETLRVGIAGTTVQEAVDRAADGDTVLVPRGTYREHVRITKSITLRGQGAILDGGGEGTVLVVGARGAIVEGMTIEGSGSDLGAPDCGIYTEPSAIGVELRNNVVRDCAFGIWIHETNRAKIVNNQVYGRSEVREADRGNGIHLFDADFLVVSGNHVTGARDGIYVSATDDSLISDNRVEDLRYGIHYMYSYRNTIRDNHMIGNLGGIALMQSRNLVITGNVASDNQRFGVLFRDAQECEIRDNVFERNGQGMFFFSSTDNVIASNRVAHNDIGAKIWAGSLRNDVRDNVFLGNRQQIFYVGAEDLIWGAETRGNTWGDYAGWDQDGDGIGDRPYRVDSFTATLVYRHPSAVLLLRSPVLELLAHLEERLPMLRVPTVVDRSPVMSEASR